MSDHIPIELQEQIIKKLHVKSLLQCRSVSKTWKSLIDSSEFIAAQALGDTDHTQRRHHHLFVSTRMNDFNTKEQVHVCFVDDHTFPQSKFVPSVPILVSQLRRSKVIGTSLGLFCLTGFHDEHGYMAVLWNPSIRKSVAIDIPAVLPPSYDAFIGFGVCPNTLDPKIVRFPETSGPKIRHPLKFNNLLGRLVALPLPRKVEVYSLSSRKWRSVSSNLHSESIKLTTSQVVVDRFIFWLAFVWITKNNATCECDRYLIISFDITNEIFGVVDLPDHLANHRDLTWSIFKIRESFAVIECTIRDYTKCYGVWMMENGVRRSFTKVFNVTAKPNKSIRMLEFRKNGKPIMEVYDDRENQLQLTTLVARKSNSKDYNFHVGIDGVLFSFDVNSYVETLLLHGWTD